LRDTPSLYGWTWDAQIGARDSRISANHSSMARRQCHHR
jgi:hypothetical protein